MREIRLFTDQPLSAGQKVILSGDTARHLLQVLRMREGASVTLFNGDGHDYSGTLVECSKREAQALVQQQGAVEMVPKLTIHLGIGISKGDRLVFAMQKAVELGVSTITPLITERTVVRLSNERMQKRQQHWQGVITAACEQSGRSRLPVLHASTSLPAWLKGTGDVMGLLLDHRSPKNLCDLPKPNGEIRLLVGPEGGLNEVERDQAIRLGFQGIRLGPRVLRTETAPLAAIAAIQTLWGDFSLG